MNRIEAQMLKQYRRAGRTAYFDPIRAVLVEAKPEEKVRQQFLQRLIHEYLVPETAITVEYPLKKIGGTSKRRADILVLNALARPLMIVECKDPGTSLHDGVWGQASSYADELNCAYVALTNGTELEAFHRVYGEWQRLATFPSFMAMHSPLGHEYRAPKSRVFQPMASEQLEDLDFIAAHESTLWNDWRYCVIGQDTPKDLWTPIYTLYTALFHQPDTDLSLPMETDNFRVEEYLGLYFTEYGNYAGGKFPGLYASFRIVDHHGDDQIYKVGFFSTAHTENHPSWGNRRGTSGIHVAIDDFDNTPHMSLELCLDTCMKAHRGGFEIVHDGKITVGRLGAAKRDALIDYVAGQAPHLVGGRSVMLGSFPVGETLAFADVRDLVFNLLHYAEIRDRFRVDHKQSKRLDGPRTRFSRADEHDGGDIDLSSSGHAPRKIELL